MEYAVAGNCIGEIIGAERVILCSEEGSEEDSDDLLM